MPPNDKAGRVVFVGNISYTTSEEQIIDTLSRVGQVLNFRLVYDKETGKPKGFGFAEYADGDAAASAVRNLNEYDLNNRKLRVDWSNDNGSGDSGNAANTNANAAYNPPIPPPNGQPDLAQQSSTLPPLPPGTDPQDGLTCGDAISRTLQTLPPPQLLDILSQMKGLVTTDPAKAVELLRQAPQLAYALFQALLLLNLVDVNVLGQVIDTGGAPQAAAPPQPQPPPQQQPPPIAQPPRQFPSYPPQAAPTPPVQQQPPPQNYGQPAAQQPQLPPQLAGLTPEQQQQYATILQLTPEQIGSLPPDHQKQIYDIRRAFGL